VSEHRVAVVNEHDLAAIYAACKGKSTGSINLTGLTLSQQLVVEACICWKDSIMRRAPFDTDAQLAALLKEDAEYYGELFQEIEPPCFIICENKAPRQVGRLDFRDLKTNSAYFIKAGYNTYNWIGQHVSESLRAFCATYRTKMEADVMPEGAERGDFRALFNDFGDMNEEQIRQAKKELNKQIIVQPLEPLTVKLDFTSYLDQRAEPFERPSKYSLKYHVVTDQRNTSYDVNGTYNWELEPLKTAPKCPEVTNAKAVVHLFSSMAHLVTFFFQGMEKPYRVFVWKGQHTQNSQVFN